MYYIARVQIKFEDDNGKVKKRTEQYLVHALSITEAEAVVTESFISAPTLQYEIKSISESRIVEILPVNN
jgi:hypothetical protein